MKLLRRLIIVVLLLLIIGALVAAEMVRRSDLPRQVVLERISELTGLSAQADRLTVTWSGQTTISELRLSLPLEDKPLLVVPTLRVSHGALWKLLLGADLNLRGIRAEQPIIALRQDESGRWNLQELIDRLQLAPSNRDSPPTASVRLPDIDITGAELTIRDSAGRAMKLSPVAVAGRNTAGAFAFGLEVPHLLSADGRVHAGADWPHEVVLALDNGHKPLRPWLEEVISALALQGRWDGRISDGALVGELKLTDGAVVNEVRATGDVGLRVSGDGLTVLPRDLKLRPEPWLKETIRLTGGSAQLVGNVIHARRLAMQGFDGQAWLDGKVDLNTSAGDLNLAWDRVQYPSGITHAGRADIRLQPVAPNRFDVQATVYSTGRSPAGEWKGDLSLQGSGQSLRTAQGSLLVKQFAWQTGERAFDVENLSANVALDGSRIVLQSVSTGDAGALAGEGWFDYESTAWQAAWRGERWPIHFGDVPDYRYALSVTGQGQQFEIADVKLAREGIVITASGAYQPDRPKPLQVQLHLSRDEMTLQPEHVAALRTRNIESDFTLAGTLSPLELKLEGDATAYTLTIADQLIQDALRVTVSGEVDAHGLRFSSNRFELFDGTWVLSGDSAKRELELEASDVSLQPLAQLFNAPIPVQGKAQANLSVTVPIQADRKPSVRGDWRLDQLSLAGYGVDAIAGKVELARGSLRLSDIRATRGEGAVTGSGQLQLATRMLRVDASVSKWPVFDESAATQLRLDGEIEAGADLKVYTVHGGATLQSALFVDQSLVGTQKVVGKFSGKSFVLNTVGGDLFQGPIEGDGVIMLDQIAGNRIELRWEGIDAVKVAAVWPALEGAGGTLSGRISIVAPMDAPRDRAVELSISMDTAEGGYGRIAVRRVTAGGYADLSHLDAPRLVLDESRWTVGEGELRLRGRVSRHNDLWHMFAHADFDRVDIQPIQRTFTDEGEPIAGLLSGWLRVTMPIGQPKRAYGDARLAVDKSDLANRGVFAKLYNLLNLSTRSTEALGQGAMQARLEGTQLDIAWLRYDNRGQQLRASGQISDLSLGLESPVSGYAIGTSKPLPNLPLIEDIVSDFQEGFAVLQGDLTAIGITGTLAQPRRYILKSPRTFEALRVLLNMRDNEQPAP